MCSYYVSIYWMQMFWKGMVIDYMNKTGLYINFWKSLLTTFWNKLVYSDSFIFFQNDS